MTTFEQKYHLEVYEIDWVNDPSISWSSNYLFPSIAVGDYFEHRAYNRWQTELKKDERFIVKEIKHIFWEETDSVCHKLMVLLDIVSS